MHWIGNKTKLGFAEAVPVDEFFDGVQIRSARLERLNQVLTWWKGWDGLAGTFDEGELLFDLRDDGRQRAAAITGLVLDTVPAVGIVAGGDEEPGGRAGVLEKKADCGGGTGLVGKPYRSTGRRNRFRNRSRHGIGGETVVVADQHAFPRIFAAHHIASNRLRHNA